MTEREGRPAVAAVVLTQQKRMFSSSRHPGCRSCRGVCAAIVTCRVLQQRTCHAALSLAAAGQLQEEAVMLWLQHMLPYPTPAQLG